MSDEPSAGRLTTTVIDALRGAPADGMLVDLFRLPSIAGERHHLCTVETAAGGAAPTTLLDGAALTAASYELLFHVGRYFKARQVTLEDAPFLDVIPVRFAIGDPGKPHHLTLLASPWAYTVYRS
ncbi:MAG TPA: hydroxyisourate hydrolase [Stellaceae bacterium]|nr:hydroxyisourate hydrolase [Stellaceae bacterium]